MAEQWLYSTAIRGPLWGPAASGNTFVNYDNGNCYPKGGSVGWDNRQGFFEPVSNNVNTSRFVNNTVNRFTWEQKNVDKPITWEPCFARAGTA